MHGFTSLARPLCITLALFTATLLLLPGSVRALTHRNGVVALIDGLTAHLAIASR